MIYNTASDLQFDSTIRQQGKSTTYALIEDLIKAFELSNAIIIFFDFMILFYLVEHEHKARKIPTEMAHNMDSQVDDNKQKEKS